MDITGAKWKLVSAKAVLRLRALRSSNDFDEYWKFHEAGIIRNFMLTMKFRLQNLRTLLPEKVISG